MKPNTLQIFDGREGRHGGGRRTYLVIQGPKREVVRETTARDGARCKTRVERLWNSDAKQKDNIW
jgi:hypothetical protein